MVLERSAEVNIPVRIERMKLDDVETVAKLDEKCFPTPWSVSAYITETHNHSAYYIVAKIDDRIVGFAGEWLIMDEAHITTIGVDPEFRGKRVGERMLINLIDEAVYRGIKRMTLEVRKYNHVAQKLYRKYGFHAAAVRKGYYTDNNEDALVMWIDDLRDSGFLQLFRTYKERFQEGLADG